MGRTVVECTRDRLAARISRDVAAVAPEGATPGAVVVDPFAGSGNALLWLTHRLKARIAVGFESDETVAALTQRHVELLDVPIVVLRERYERGLREMQVGEDDLVVVFVAPPWGDALRQDAGLDLRDTTPPVAEVVDRVAVTFGTLRVLLAVQLYERVEPTSLGDLADRCDWSRRQTYAIDPPGRNYGLLLGTLGWTPTAGPAAVTPRPPP